MAQAPGGPDCGWGNMLFEGQRGTPAHFLASTTNGTSGNATFGMTSGTNGCSTNGALTYGGKSWLAMNGMMDELSKDMAMGQGEALTTLCGIHRRPCAQDRSPAFSSQKAGSPFLTSLD
nr:DUF3015 family protein [Pseudomonas amygdali]